MAEEPDNLVVQLLRAMGAENSACFDEVVDDVRRGLRDVRLGVGSLDLCFDEVDERVETIREGAVSAVGYAANASRADVDLHRQIDDLRRRVETLEASR